MMAKLWAEGGGSSWSMATSSTSAGMCKIPKDMGESACELIADAKVRASAGHDPRWTYTISGWTLAHTPCGTGHSSAF